MASRLLPATSGHGRELCQEVGEASEPVQATGSEQEWIDLVQIPALGPELVTLGKAPNSRVSGSVKSKGRIPSPSPQRCEIKKTRGKALSPRSGNESTPYCGIIIIIIKMSSIIYLINTNLNGIVP